MKLSSADDRVLLSRWLPPQAGVVPKVRIGNRWVNVLWALPLIFLALVLGSHLPKRCENSRRFNVSPALPWCADGSCSRHFRFPAWLRLLHFS